MNVPVELGTDPQYMAHVQLLADIWLIPHLVKHTPQICFKYDSYMVNTWLIFG